MTRINCGILPIELTNKHLIAEHREIKRIPNCVSKGRFNLKNQPEKFTLGTGHVKFFYDKLGYLKKRYEELYVECLKRNINVQYYGNSWNDVPKEMMNDYCPTDSDRKLIRQRILEKLTNKKLDNGTF
nr:hypothetical protein [uncultured archaeon]